MAVTKTKTAAIERAYLNSYGPMRAAFTDACIAGFTGPALAALVKTTAARVRALEDWNRSVAAREYALARRIEARPGLAAINTRLIARHHLLKARTLERHRDVLNARIARAGGAA